MSSKLSGLRILLADAEEENRRAEVALRAGIKGAEARKVRAEVEVEKWRRAVAVASGAV